MHNKPISSNESKDSSVEYWDTNNRLFYRVSNIATRNSRSKRHNQQICEPDQTIEHPFSPADHQLETLSAYSNNNDEQSTVANSNVAKDEEEMSQISESNSIITYRHQVAALLYHQDYYFKNNQHSSSRSQQDTEFLMKMLLEDLSLMKEFTVSSSDNSTEEMSNSNEESTQILNSSGNDSEVSSSLYKTPRPLSPVPFQLQDGPMSENYLKSLASLTTKVNKNSSTMITSTIPLKIAENRKDTPVNRKLVFESPESSITNSKSNFSETIDSSTIHGTVKEFKSLQSPVPKIFIKQEKSDVVKKVELNKRRALPPTRFMRPFKRLKSFTRSVFCNAGRDYLRRTNRYTEEISNAILAFHQSAGHCSHLQIIPDEQEREMEGITAFGNFIVKVKPQPYLNGELSLPTASFCDLKVIIIKIIINITNNN